MTERVTPFNDPAARFHAGRLGMWLFLVVLLMTFASTILGYIVVRLNNGAAFIPANAPPPPPLLLVSTVVLLLSSVTMQKALKAARTGSASQGGLMVATTALAVAFLGSQVFAWREMWMQNQTITDNLYAWTFYVLTGLHAAHVIGGLVPLTICSWRASHRAYGPEDHRGITYCAMYWHFLDAIWIVMYATLWLGSRR